jgi:hypothetical protein
MTTLPKGVLALALLIVVQVGLVFGYRWLEERRSGEGLGVAMEQRFEPAAGFAIEHPDGLRERVTARSDRFQLVHFWATWCPPCRKELPTLLERAGRSPDRLRVWIVSVDPDWDAVRRYFDDVVPAGVVRDPDGAGSRAYRVTGLPDTYLIDPQGRVVARFAGARNWTSAKMDAVIERVMEEGRRRLRGSS